MLLALLAAGCLGAASQVAAQSYSVARAGAPPPTELSAAVRDTLSSEVLKVSGPKGLLCEVWLRKSLPTAAAPSQEADVKLTRIAEGTLIGAIRLAGDTGDFRQQTIPAGVYTLRYALIPVDGDHLGSATSR
jgi:hypothetical protein